LPCSVYVIIQFIAWMPNKDRAGLSVEFLWPLARAVENGQNLDFRVAHTVRHDEGRIDDNEFPGVGNAARTPYMRERRKIIGPIEDRRDNARGDGGGIVTLDV
jgi:hypothetical protein